MKRRCIILALGMVMLVACRHEDRHIGDIATSTIDGVRRYCMTYNDRSQMYQEAKYKIEWPNDGQLSESMMNELRQAMFGDSTAIDLSEAIEQWPKTTLTGDINANWQEVDSILDKTRCNYQSIMAKLVRDSIIATYTIDRSSYLAGAAHGLYSTALVTIDLDAERIVELADVVDTSRMGEAIAQAIHEIEANRGVQECLMEEYTEATQMPLPSTFGIDLKGGKIEAIYGLYEITPYACGIQRVALPIEWLDRHGMLTAYAKQLYRLK